MLPKMRTAAGAIREIKAMDPNTEITEGAIRRAIKRGEIQSVPNGVRRLVNLDDVVAHFSGQTAGMVST